MIALSPSGPNCYKPAMGSDLKVGFLGAGKMASALGKGIVQAGIVRTENLVASDPVEAARASFTKETGGRAAASNIEVVKSATVLIVAVKPDHVTELLAEVKGHLMKEHLIISIAAGVPLDRFESALGPQARVIRVMPNTPALVGASAAGFALGKAATSEDGQLAQKIFSAVGVAFQLKERLLDAVTGLSGSGPAYAFLLIEALSDGGVAAGLPRDVATRLAAQTLFGSAKMVLETGMHPGILKDMVTSPGGTTIDGIHELEKAGVRGALINAVRAASEKSKKLGQS
jgi:pyrroline-5-carboxylate reductase